MSSQNIFAKSGYSKLYEVLDESAIDQILFYLAENAMRRGGHRYGAFLDAATTAAKFAIYITYLEEHQNLRKTGRLHHLEPKRVKEIVQEIQDALVQGKLLKILGSQEPRYLISLPYLWQQHYPLQPHQPRLKSNSLTPKEKQAIEDQLPPHLPQARVLDSFEFTELLEELHLKFQENLPPSHQVPLSEAMTEHIKMQLLHSGTVLQLESPVPGGLPFYALARTTYSPANKQERTYTMIEDVARFFRLLQAWVDEDLGVLRALETFDIAIEDRENALQELGQLVQAWADKYHREGGYPMVLQIAAGTRED